MFVQSLQEVNNSKFTYDHIHDVLYVYFGDPRISYDDEVAPGIFIRFADADDTITGFIIMDYKKRNIPYLSRMIPINFDYHQINNKIS
ncbi:DUF2283 domain-containing protein [Ectobacillus polymachus]|uniref:DUF2283 domain-containing protein n=1 Tax=Ectobacillus polymachus TaxID=1508806 RepID=UPI003A8AB4CE